MKDLQVGDVVKLRSSDVLMTVECISDTYKSCKCIWFDNQGCLHDRNIHFTSLEFVKRQ